MQLSPRFRAHAAGAASVVLVALAAHVAADDKWRLALDTMVYTDTDNVTVVTPATSVRYRLDDDGGELRARVGVDAVTAASVDLLAQATQRFTEARTEVNLGVSKAVGEWVPSLDYRLSYEGDYFSNGVHAGVRHRIGSPDTVLDVGYGFTYDVIGRTGTLFQLSEGQQGSHRVDASLTQTVDRDTLIRGAFTFIAHAGYQAKPYRLVPIFDPTVLAAAEAAGTRLDLHNFADFNPIHASEALPYYRVGTAYAVRLLRYLDLLHGSLRLDYQLYFDTWGLVANVLEPALSFAPSSEWLFTLYARLYIQGGVAFWRREYTQDPTLTQIPTYRTLDREMSPFESATGGARVEWRIPDPAFGLYVDMALAYTHYDQFLYLDERVALIAQAGVRWAP